ncbi:MAG: histidine triad nucleotide-binding protein [Thermomicrobiales bacterium]|nr:histidine triad nucleotide-binding protein [Thermomicrobiales bacterium]
MTPAKRRGDRGGDSNVADAANCLFCAIASGALGTEFIAESDRAVAFRDIQPQAPSHVLVVPRQHVAALRDLEPDDDVMAAELLRLAAEVARREGLLAGGYRVVINDGDDAGQTVHHLHLHVLGGRKLNEPLG